MLKLFIGFLSILLSVQVFAQGAVSAGDGGHGVVCPNFSPQYLGYDSLELLDLYEARRLFYRKMYRQTVAQADLVLWSKRSKVCGELTERKRSLTKILGRDHQILNAFSEACAIDLRFTHEVANTHDAGKLQVKLPQNCELVQIAVRKNIGGKPVVFLSYDYSDHLSVTDAAAILLHEALHQYFRNRSTVAIRQFVGYTFGHRAFRERNAHVIKQLADTRQQIDPLIIK